MEAENKIKNLYYSLEVLLEVLNCYPDKSYDLEVLDDRIKIKTDAPGIGYREYDGLIVEPMSEENGEKLSARECFVLASEIINSRAKALLASRIR